MASSITDSTFESEVLNASEPVVVDFWAEWCGPCKAMTPIVDALASEIAGVKVVKVNIDENPNTPAKYGIRGIPTFMVFKGGKLIDTKVGGMSKSAMTDWIKDKIA